ncbi:MAG: nucleotidyl transferase AbiEii/AbiGii toxin family protein [bacterium]|nr:nucleotidyl transferase AbiEii/AbiGii toxin family protein [bacterium]
MLKISTHKLIITKIIKDIYSDISIGSALGFKGGTALYLFYHLPRFSVDLDFDLLDESKSEIVFINITKIINKYGLLKEKSEKYFTLFWLLSYEKGVNHIKIEISKRSSGNEYEVKNYLGLSALVMKKEDMFANKLTALLDRKKLANRDIFDIWFMLNSHWDFNEDLLKLRTKTEPKKYLQKCLNLIEKRTSSNILDGMGELLDNKMKDWVKKNLIKDTIFLLRARYEI